MHVLVVSGGPRPNPAAISRIGIVDAVVAADSGYDNALALGLRVHRLIGDLDSVTPSGLIHAETRGVEVERHPRTKDAIDLELALLGALADGADHITVLGSCGGRLDHLVAGLVHLCAPAYAACRVEAYLDEAHVQVGRPAHPVRVVARPGALVSVLAMGGPATVSLSGLRYEITDAELDPLATLGVSNEVGPTGEGMVRVSSGVVLVLEPEALRDAPR